MHPFCRAFALFAVVGLVACDDEGGADPDVPVDAAVDSAPISDMAADAEPDGGEPDPDAGPEMMGCVLPDVDIEPGLVATDRGYVQGVPDGDSWTWKGMPFAAPPVGDLRFGPPTEPACWDDVRPAEAFGPRCPQVEFSADGFAPVGEEDCLSINVWSPVGGDDGARRPVLFFIHGGANIIGSAREEIAAGRPIYRGAALATRGDAVVVTMQYRLGPLGFLALPELDAESDVGTSGNWGTLDQIAALEWVQRNIAAFGGDPDRVMVFGESAGAINTCMMLASPLAEGLFHRALMQSGGCGAVTAEQARAVGGRAADLVDCGAGDDRLACLRALDAHDLVSRASGSVGLGASPTDNGLTWGPSIDGHALTADPLTRFSEGAHGAVPVVVGSNADEMASRALNRVQINSAEDYTNAVRATFGILGGDAIDRIFEAYPVDEFESPDDAFVQVTTDAIFTCAARNTARVLALGQDEAVYRYMFSRRFVTAMGEGRAQHGIELLYVFGTLSDIPFYQPAPEDVAVADQMMDAWLAFAATGDPSGGAAGAWPPYDDTETSLIFDAPPGTEDGLRGAKCDLWDALLAGLDE